MPSDTRIYPEIVAVIEKLEKCIHTVKGGIVSYPTLDRAQAEKILAPLLLELDEWRNSTTAETLKRYQDELRSEINCRVANQDRVRQLSDELAAIAGSGVEMGKVNRVEEKSRFKIIRLHERRRLVVDTLYSDMPVAQFWETKIGGRHEDPQLMAEECVERLNQIALQPAGSAETGGEKAIDEQFKGMATDEKYQAETLKIEKEFAQSDWEALLASEDWIQFRRDPDNGAGLHAVFIDGTPIHHFKSHQRPAPYIQRVRDAVKRVAERLANFPRPSQNQTATSGVEGAHEGTTADKNTYDESTDFCEKLMSSSLAPTRVPELRESREPAKLNNAQNEQCFICYEWPNPLAGNPSEWPIRLPSLNGNGKLRTYCTKCVMVALAESSLSSPPPEEKK